MGPGTAESRSHSGRRSHCWSLCSPPRPGEREMDTRKPASSAFKIPPSTPPTRERGTRNMALGAFTQALLETRGQARQGCPQKCSAEGGSEDDHWPRAHASKPRLSDQGDRQEGGRQKQSSLSTPGHAGLSCCTARLDHSLSLLSLSSARLALGQAEPPFSWKS